MTATPESDSGLSALELAEIPDPHRKLLQLILRFVEATEAELLDAMQAWSPADQLEAAPLTEALQSLCEKRWLSLIPNEAEPAAAPRYKVNFARRPKTPPAESVWDNL